MAFQLVAFFAVLVCASATHVLPNPYAIGGLSSQWYGGGHDASIPIAYPGYPVQSGLIGDQVLGVAPLSLGHGAVPLPQGKTTVTKTFISTPTYATSHVSERLHTEEPAYGQYSYGSNVVKQPLYAPLPYEGPIVSPIVYGAKYGW
ncbi:uncharacterized protein LOC118465570 [Anopheles albimanus]|uniref:Uncharacterized protein n=1 Tax=Anopheles albimanus TaxID=7167 RepID=A0A182FUD5_ANOAL|nr:uncharacterized protein LOC118465570 [Anopheles albimanus]